MTVKTQLPSPATAPEPGDVTTSPASGYERPTVERLALEDVVRFEGGSVADGFGSKIPVIP